MVQVAVVAVTKTERNKGLAALTTAALSLPGLNASAAIPAANIIGNVSYGHYEESDNRMRVDVYHADATIPLSDRLELAFSLDRDTYSGATPAFSVPTIMTNVAKYKQKTDGSSSTEPTLVDIVSAASGGITAGGLTILGGLNSFQSFQDGSKAAAPFLQAQEQRLSAPLLAQLTTDKSFLDSQKTTAVSLAEAEHANQLAAINAAYTLKKSLLDTQHNLELSLVSGDLPGKLSLLDTDYNNKKSVLDNAKDLAHQNYIAINPEPAGPVSIKDEIVIDFENLSIASYSGKTNALPRSGSSTLLLPVNPDNPPNPDNRCVESALQRCIYSHANTSIPNRINNIAIGTLDDTTPGTTEHLHQVDTNNNKSLGYHSDSAGIFVRAVNGSAFSLDSMDFKAPINSGNPDSGVNDYWEILGFKDPILPNLDIGDGTNYAERVAYQTVANGFNASLALNSNFRNIKSFWIHYKGYPQTPNDGKAFAMEVDNIKLSPIPNNSLTPEQIAWNTAFQSFKTTYDNTIYRPQLDPLTTTYQAEKLALTSTFQAEIDKLEAQHATSLANLTSETEALKQPVIDQHKAELANLLARYHTANDQLDNEFSAKVSAISNALTKTSTIGLYQQILNRSVPNGTQTVERFQLQPQETRSMPQFSARYYFDNTTLTASGGLSDEPDYLSNFGSINVSHEFNDKLTTLSYGYSLTTNEILRGTDSNHSAATAHNHGGNDNSPQYAKLNETSDFNGFNLGLSQIFDKDTLFQSTINFTHQSGYLSNPYKFVYVRGEVTAEEYYSIYQASTGAPIDWKSITQLEMVGTELFRETRPNNRNQWSFSNRLNHYIPQLDAALHFDYRFYTDDWSVNSHTFELKWLQSLPGGITVTPNIRYYSQSQAEFFAPYFLAPRADGFYSSDFRLSGFGNLSGGLTLSKEFARGIKLEAGVEYTTHAGGLKLGGGGVGDYADFDYFMAHANLNIDFAARPFAMGGGAGDHHHMHHHHGAPIPAGVMFGHMMNQADEIMVGYRFQYNVQSGSMLNGSNQISDALLANTGCMGKCEYRPMKMHMQMHMLDLMYAPTDWLNVMVMPQLMSMDMSMSNSLDPSVTNDEHGGAKHTSNDIGDTLAVAMVKIVDTGDHHVHAGIGMSAPTGSIDAELTPPSLKSPNSTEIDPGSATLQDYGMQLGSGTWDFKPSLTYSGHSNDWGWGAQLNGTKRLEKNKYGFAYGDIFQATSWGSYAIFDWLSATVRGVYTWQDRIHGQTDQNHETTSPVDYPSNYGGRFWDVGLGLNASIPDGGFAGHNLSVEWLQPVATDFNGYQLDRDGALTATWNFSF